MPIPGWYPDPGGRPGHYRFWDGQTWAPTTTTTLGDVPADVSRAARRRRRLGPWLVAAAALAVAVVVVALVLAPGRPPVAAPVLSPSVEYSGSYGPPSVSTSTPEPTAPEPATPEPTTPEPTSSGPMVVPTPLPSPTLEPSPGELPTTRLRTQDCPLGDPLTSQDHPADGRVHGGGLSFTPPAAWVQGPRAGAFSWAYDVGEADQRVHGTWFTGAAVGALSVADGAVDARSGAELAMSCTATPYFYSGTLTRTDLVDRATTVDGCPAWTIRAEIRARNPYVDVDGDVVEITVVDVGSPESFAFFWGDAPIGDEELLAQVDEVARHLRVD